MYGPLRILLDNSENLYLSDYSDRVLVFPAGSTTATSVFGQTLFSDSAPNRNGLPSSSSLNYPTGLALDVHGNVLIADGNNNGVLVVPPFVPPNAINPAIRVYGHN